MALSASTDAELRRAMAVRATAVKLKRQHVAGAALQGRINAQAQRIDLDLLDFIPALTPTLLGHPTERPDHLSQVCEAFERIERGEEVRVLLSVPPQFGKPLHVDTLVTLATGERRRMGSLRVGDAVVSGGGRLTTITAIYPQGVLPTVEIVLRSGRVIRAESSHRFLSQRGWLRADELRAYGRDAWRRPRGDYLVVKADYERVIDRSVSTTEARLLGYLIGDGNTTQRNVRFTNIDPALRVAFDECVRALGGNTVNDDAQTMRVRGAARSIVREHGLQGKRAPEKRVPVAIWTSSNVAIATFLAAYFECDGSRSKKVGTNTRATTLSSVSRELLEDVRSLLSRLGIGSTLNLKRGRYKGEPHLSWLLTVRDDQRFFRILPVLGAKAGPSALSRHLDVDGDRLDQVVAVRPAEPAECVCITVADDESFLANDVVTHNTESILHGIARALARHREWPIVYASYSAEMAHDKSRLARDYARRAGVELRDDADAVGGWLTPTGGGLRARGVGGPLSGAPAKILVVDDPHKDRAEAESPLVRQRVFEWFTSTAMTRIHPGSSVIVLHTRWHADDLIGRLSKQTKQDADGNEVPVWEIINLPAILPNGEPLWHRRPLSFLEQHKRGNEYDWHSLWMGSPRPRGDSVFRGVTFYDRLPHRFQIGKGLDLAYTRKTRAHYSCGITLLSSTEDGDDPVCYIVDVRRKQCEVPDFARELHDVDREWRGGEWHWFSSSTERGVAQLLREKGIDVNDVLATVDKFSRAQPASAAWNAGRILVPRSMAAILGDRATEDDRTREPSWLRPFVDEIGAFTGVGDKADDHVDALASAFESVRYGKQAPPRTGRSSYRYGEGDGRGLY